MKRIFTIMLLGVALTAAAQEEKTCLQWQNQFEAEVTNLKADLASLKTKSKLDKSAEMKAAIQEKKDDLKAAQTNLKIAKEAVKNEKAAEKALLKATKQSTKLQQQKDKADNAVIKAQKAAANSEKKISDAQKKLDKARQDAEKKIASAQANLDKARQDAEKANSGVDQAKQKVTNIQSEGDITESAIKKAQEQKAAAKQMIISKVILRPDGSSGTKK